jgi:hypothetical protein
MRSIVITAASICAALAFGANPAAAAAALPFHAQTCLPPQGERVICFEAWGVFKTQQSAGGNGVTIDLAHRHFSEYTSGVLTFEQRDMSHHVVHTDGNGAARITVDLFSGWSTRTGLLCTWREHFVVVNGDLVHSVDESACRST